MSSSSEQFYKIEGDDLINLKTEAVKRFNMQILKLQNKVKVKDMRHRNKIIIQ